MSSNPTAPEPARRSVASRAIEATLVGLVRAYQVGVSPLIGVVFGATCRFTPSCSEYMVLALRKHGPIRGLRLGLGRLLRCHPWGGGGHDPP